MKNNAVLCINGPRVNEPQKHAPSGSQLPLFLPLHTEYRKPLN